MNKCILAIYVIFILLAIIIPLIIVFYGEKTISSNIENQNGEENQGGMKPLGYDNLIFSDNFEGESLNTDKWKYFTSGDPTKSCAIYRNPGEISVNNGILRLGMKWNDNGKGIVTGRIYSSKQFTYGYYEARIRINNFSNLMWPAFWLVPEDGEPKKYGTWPRSGEIDILEAINGNKDLHCTLHCGQKADSSITTAYTGVNVAKKEVDFSQWHVFGCLRDTEKISFYLDGNNIGTISLSDNRLKNCEIENIKNSPWDTPMNIIFNLAVGGEWAAAVATEGNECKCDISGTNCGGYTNCTNLICKGLNIEGNMEIDWVNVWTK